MIPVLIVSMDICGPTRTSPVSYMIGLGSGQGDRGLLDTFMSVPDTRDQIQSVNVYCISFGDYTLGGSVDVQMKDGLCTVEYDNMSSSVDIVHVATGRLVIQN